MNPKKILPTGSVFGDMGKYWAEIANANATEKQLTLVKKVFAFTEGLILDLGCGTGRHTVPLCRAGYNMVGLDFSLTLLRIAKNSAALSGIGCEFVRADMRFLPFQSRIFAGIMSLDTSFGYSPSEEGDLKVLIETKRVLSNNGQLMVDVFNYGNVIARYKRRFSYGFESRFWSYLLHFMARFPKFSGLIVGLFKWRNYPDFYLLEKRMANVKSGELIDIWLVRNKQGGQMRVFVHVVRLYDLPRLQGLFEKASLSVKSIYGGYKEKQYTDTSNRLIIVAQ